MNKPAANPLPEWTEAPAAPAPRAQGYEAWLEAEIASGIADLEAGRATLLSDLRRELGLE